MSRPYILVTGATSGIGGAIVEELSKSYNLILHGRNAEKLSEVVAKCCPGEHLTWEYNLECLDTLQVDFESFVRGRGVEICGFVHCAGIATMTAIKTIDLSMLRRIVDINAFSAILLTGSLMKARIAGKTMKSIVFISSVAAFGGVLGNSLYAASKGTLNSFVSSSAVELSQSKVRINSVCPGAVQTKMADEILLDPHDSLIVQKRQSLGIGCPSDISGLVEFLISNRSGWITGQNFIIDGGAINDLTIK